MTHVRVCLEGPLSLRSGQAHLALLSRQPAAWALQPAAAGMAVEGAAGVVAAFLAEAEVSCGAAAAAAVPPPLLSLLPPTPAPAAARL